MRNGLHNRVPRELDEDHIHRNLARRRPVLLFRAIQKTITALKPDDFENLTYIQLAAMPKEGNGGWSNKLEKALVKLNEYISVPLVEIVPGTVSNFMTTQKGVDFKKYSKEHTLEELFRKKKTDFYLDSDVDPNKLRKLEAIHEARDIGLLWCIPRGNYQVRKPGPKETANGWKCDVTGTNCDVRSEGSYCQLVDGSCNAMSS